ncbi:MAG: glycosyltransferase [Alphaproteobacteria bacterium]|nr:glycosyltransferase [Alphaproteobacteria bacterium]
MGLDPKHFPLFSIITVTLNNYAGFIKTYNSLKIQEFEDFEWLVIDGGSSDKTVEFLRSHRSTTRTDKNPFRFVSHTDEGVYDAMNTGIKMAKGHYLLFLNAGDALADAKTLDMLAPICEKNPDFVYGDAFEQAKNGRKPVAKPARSQEEIHWGMFTHHQAMLYRRHIVRDTRLHYSLRYKIASDYDFTVRYLKKCKNIRYTNKPICIFELGGISQQNAWQGRKEQYIIREILEMASLPQNLWILFVQTLSWQLKAALPWLYNLLKPAGKQLVKGNSSKA